MLEVLVEQRFYVTAVLLFSVGLAALLLHPNLIKKIIGLNLMDTAVFLFLAAMGYVDGGKAPMVEPGAEAAAYINPVPGGLVLTGIVVAVSHGPVFGTDPPAVSEVPQRQFGCDPDAGPEGNGRRVTEQVDAEEVKRNCPCRITSPFSASCSPWSAGSWSP